MKKRIAIVSGIRTPFCKSQGQIKDMQADDLGAYAVKELFQRSGVPLNEIDEVIIGNVIAPPHGANIARLISVKAGLPEGIPSYTVSRNCASGMEAVHSGATKILNGEANVIIAGGVESMSNIPILFPNQMRDFLIRLNKSKGALGRLKALFGFRPSMLVPQMPGLVDPLCGLSMGQTAEKLVKEFRVTREEQDLFALQSHLRAAKAENDGRFKEEITPIPLPPYYTSYLEKDDGPRGNQTLEALAKLKPVFEKINGTVTAGNSSPITDGAAALYLMSEEKAKALGLKPLGYLIGVAEAGLDPSRMGLGPAYAAAKLFKKTGVSLKDIDLIEINEAFAAQVLSVMKAFNSNEFAKNHLGQDKALGEINPEIINVNGGAIALGHPLGASGTRLILTLLLELKRRNKRLGLAALCIGGGQGQASLLEVES